MKEGILKRLLKVIGVFIAIPLVVYLIILFSWFIGGFFDNNCRIGVGFLIILAGILGGAFGVYILYFIDRGIGAITDYIREGETSMNNSFIVDHVYCDVIFPNIEKFKNWREVKKRIKIKKLKQNGELSYCENSNDGNLSLCKERRKIINE